MRFLNFIAHPAASLALTLCVLPLLMSGCTSLGGLTSARVTLPPAPQTPGAVVSEEFICIPHAEAAELLLWIENAEKGHD